MPDHWTTKPLSALAGYVNGAPFKPADFTGDGLPVIRIRQLLDVAAPVDRYDGPVDTRNLIDDDDLIFSWSATLAVVRWNRGKAILNQHLFKVVEADGIDRGWLALALEHCIPQMLTMVHGTTMKHITKSVLDRITVAVPPLDEQLCIVDLLQSVDRLIHSYDSVQHSLSVFVTSYREATFDGATEVAPLGSLCEADGIQIGPFGSQLHAADYVESGTPFVMPTNITGGQIRSTGVARVSNADAARLRRHRLTPGDIVLPRRGDLTKRALVQDQQDGWLCGTGCIRVRVTKAAPALVFEALSTARADAWLMKHAVGTTMLNLNTAIVSAIPVALPPEAEVAVDTLRAAAEYGRHLAAAVKAAVWLRDGLLSSLLSGAHEISDAYSAPGDGA